LLAGAFSAMTPRKATKIPPPPQWLFLAILTAAALLYFSAIVHGEELPWRQERLLPPVAFDRDYKDGELQIIRISFRYIAMICKSSLAPGQVTLGCAQRFLDKKCRILIATDEELEQYGLSYDVAFRHERAHCLGATHDAKGWWLQ
jgi:hypothetical protein